jgi:hypothetical protein
MSVVACKRSAASSVEKETTGRKKARSAAEGKCEPIPGRLPERSQAERVIDPPAPETFAINEVDRIL